MATPSLLRQRWNELETESSPKGKVESDHLFLLKSYTLLEIGDNLWIPEG